MHFFEAAADCADRHALDLSFFRDEYDGWYAKVQMRDARGPFSALIPVKKPNPASKKKRAETVDDFSERVQALILSAMQSARAGRAGTLSPKAQFVAD